MKRPHHMDRFYMKESTHQWVGAVDWLSSAPYALQPPLPAVGQPKTAQQSFEVGLAAAAPPRQQTPERRQREMRLREEEQGRRIALHQQPPRRGQPGELDRCWAVRPSTPGRVEEALKTEPAWLLRLAGVLPPVVGCIAAGKAAVADLVVERRPGNR